LLIIVRMKAVPSLGFLMAGCSWGPKAGQHAHAALPEIVTANIAEVTRYQTETRALPEGTQIIATGRQTADAAAPNYDTPSL
jgi:hypothetical protein